MIRMIALAIGLLSLCADRLPAQSLGGAGSIEGTVTDPSDSLVPEAVITITNRLTNYRRTTTADTKGGFRFNNVPPNHYHLDVAAPSFSTYERDVDVRGPVPVNVPVKLAVAGTQTTVTVEGTGAHMVENVAYAHNDVDMKMLDKLSLTTPSSGVSDAVTQSSGAVVADSNGFFHPLGDHAQTSFSVDGQPISDQQSKQFSTQIPLNAIQSMELITGAPPAEFGDKTSLVVNAVTRTGLAQKTNGSFQAQWGSFGTYAEEATLGFGNARVGNFIAVNALRSGRFLDTPEFSPIHAIGNSGTVFDRFDYQPDGKNALHLNLLGARNWFQIPDTYDQLGQDQRQKITTFNLAPGFQHTFNATTLLTVSPFYRIDHVDYYPSRDPFADTPATLSQSRSLANWGVKTDVSYAQGRHNLKVGMQLMQTRLNERFSLGLTDPAFNAVCVDPAGNPLGTGVRNPALCGTAGGFANPGLRPGLVPYDLTRGGKPFQFSGAAHINQAAFYAQDSIRLGGLQVQAGLRVDQYSGLTSNHGVQPRLGLSYLVKPTGTVLRVAYSRSFETPYNENLVLSSSTGQGGLAANVFGGSTVPLDPGRRNQYNAGVEQAVGKYLVIDADYFWKFTRNAYDFDTLFNTPIQFPIEWRKSKNDGLAVSISAPTLHGLQWHTTMGHTRARYFGPETGGLVFNSDVSNAVFRIDHDQAFQQTTNLRYQKGANGAWIAFTWRYDSGMVAGAVGSVADVLALSGAEQAAIGFHCGSQLPTLSTPITACASNYGATRLVIPAPGTENNDHNPGRIAPRHLFDLGVGTDSLYHREQFRVTLRFTASNLTNHEALYNFLSTFSGTHFVAPRSYQAALGFVF